MRVLVWQQYGDSKVYAADVPEHFEKIRDDLTANMKDWDEDVNINRMTKVVETQGINNMTRERAVLALVRPHIGQHEVFEYFAFTDIKV